MLWKVNKKGYFAWHGDADHDDDYDYDYDDDDDDDDDYDDDYDESQKALVNFQNNNRRYNKSSLSNYLTKLSNVASRMSQKQNLSKKIITRLNKK